MKKTEWNYIALDSLKEIFEEQFKKIDEYHGKMFVMDNLLNPFNVAKAINKNTGYSGCDSYEHI